MRTAKQIFENVVTSIEIGGNSIAYMVACGEELCIFECHPGLQKLLLDLQASEPITSARSTLRAVFNHVVVRRGSGFADIRPTPLRSTKEIEAACQTAIDGIEDGLSTLEEEFKGLRESYAALSNRIERLASEVLKLTSDKSPSNQKKACDIEHQKVLLERLRNARKSLEDDRENQDLESLRYWKIVDRESDETLGVVSAKRRRQAWSGAVSVFGRRVPLNLLLIGRQEFLSIQKQSRRVAEFFSPAGSA